MARWLSFFSNFNFKYVFEPGKSNVFADAYRVDQTSRQDSSKVCLVIRHKLSRRNVGSNKGLPRDELVGLLEKGEQKSRHTLSPAVGSLRWTNGLTSVASEAIQRRRRPHRYP